MPSPLIPLTTGPVPRVAVSPPAAADSRIARPAVAAGLGLGVTLLQLFFVLLCSGQPNPADAYRSLYQWDSQWYARIAADGYPDELPQVRPDAAKLGFFPAYPLATRLVARLTGLTITDASLVAAQLAAWGFWTYVFLFLQRWAVPGPLAYLGTVGLLIHPSTFFLVAGYSESLFLLAVLGFLYWGSVPGRLGWSLAALHGVVMTSSRIVGLPLAVCPFVLAAVELLGDRGLSWRARLRRLVPPGLLGAVALLGGGLFFGFCQLQYGRWDAYMYMQRWGWGVTPDYGAVFWPEIYRLGWPTFVGDHANPSDFYVNPNDLSRLCVPFTVLLFGVLLLVECRAARSDPARGWRQRLPFYLAGGLMFYIAVSGLANSGLVSMIRYTLCVHVMLVLAVVHLLARVSLPPGRPRYVLAGALTAAALVSLTLEIMLIRTFTHGGWVA
jgi:hypothetical protein